MTIFARGFAASLLLVASAVCAAATAGLEDRERIEKAFRMTFAGVR